jgi:LPS O-antigen subunit length determinant protein (WzzB/FepE family)
MANNLNQSTYLEDEIDLRDILKVLIESKKLIILTTLIFTIASFIYSSSLKPSFKTSTKLEVGYLTQNNGDIQLIESTSNLISDLEILLIKNPDGKFSQNISMDSLLEDKIIYLVTTSSSGEQNENFLNDVIRYIDERHSKLALSATEQKKDEISHEIDLIESELSFIKGIRKLELEDEISKLKNTIPIIDEEISQLMQVVTQESNNLKLLKGSNLSLERALNSPTLEQIISTYKSKINQLKIERISAVSELDTLSKKLDALDNGNFHDSGALKLKLGLKKAEDELQSWVTQAHVKTQPIGNIRTITIKPKTKLSIPFGIIIGFITSIFLVFIYNFLKSYREREA